MITHRILEKTSYTEYRKVKETWYEVQVLKRSWFFGIKYWLTESQTLWSTGGGFNIPLRFKDVSEASAYIANMVKGIPKQSIVTKQVTSFIS
jgi:hypothetical protein